MPTTTTPESTLRYDLLLLGVVIVWGSNFVVVKAIVDVLPPNVLNAVRMAVAVVGLGIFYTANQRKSGLKFWTPLREHPVLIGVLGLVGFGVYQALFIKGVSLTTAGSAALIMGSAPLWTAIVGAALRIERLPRAAWAALGVTFCGMVLVVAGGGARVGGSLVGNLLMAVAAITWGGYTALSRPATKRVSPSALAFFGTAVAMPFLFALAIPAWGEADWSAFGGAEWTALVYSGGLSSGLAIAAWTLGVKKVGPSNTAVYGNLVPLVALVASVIALGETVSAMQMAGGALLLAGLFWKRRAS